MDRLFRQSDLMRPKWDERRGEQTYGERTLAAAIEGTRSFPPRKSNTDRCFLSGNNGNNGNKDHFSHKNQSDDKLPFDENADSKTVTTVTDLILQYFSWRERMELASVSNRNGRINRPSTRPDSGMCLLKK
ncbi:MAG: hypothetical protein IPL99_20025 [Candidatus Competibacteraceae bacterium]|nr:hypothetical protein [Candidatus Competibacteraceae bacterium]